MAAHPYLVLSGLTKRFGDTLAVNGLDLSIRKGEFVSLLGPSGCGKTTTLQMIAGFVESTSGSVTLDGQDLLRVPPRARGLGIVFQSYALFPHMTVAGNVAFGLEMRGLPRHEREIRVREALALVSLEPYAARLPRQLSGGQQQRVAVARALASKPQFILADEPTANLDSHSTANLLDIMAMLNKEENMTFIFSTHDQRVIERARRVITLVDGKVTSDTGSAKPQTA